MGDRDRRISGGSERARSAADREDRLSCAIADLAAELAARVEAHPWRRLLRADRHSVELRLRLPALAGASLDEAQREAGRVVDEAVQRLVAQQAVFRPGRVLCLRCGVADCEHATPGDSREVFAGYRPTGLPRFVDLQQLLVERRDPRVDRLFATPPRLLTLALGEDDLHRELLPVYRELDAGFRVHGQVCAGWYALPRGAGPGGEVLALGFQVLSNAGPAIADRGSLRLALDVVGVAPGGGPLEHVLDRWPAEAGPPWAEAVRWAQRVLGDVERGARARRERIPGRRRGDAPPAATGDSDPWEERVRGVLAGLERRLQRSERSSRRRTVHAEERRRGRRPVGNALADLESARAEDVLWDRRRETLVVLGERGRAHVFSPEGRHVTSIHFTTDAIERRKRTGRWRPAPSDQLDALRERVVAESKG